MVFYPLQCLFYVALISQLCNSQSCTTQKSKSCIFPFEYQNKIYSGCSQEKVKPGKSWCSIKVDGRGEHVTGKKGITWDFCASDCHVDTEPVWMRRNQFGCIETSQCVIKDDCPQYQTFKNIPKSSRPSDYQTQRKKWIASICSKKEKRLCCPILMTTSHRTATVSSPITPSICKGETKCVYSEDCQSYKIIEHVPKSHPDFQKLEKKWKARICDWEGKLCCPVNGEYPGNYLPKPGECGKKYFDASRIIGGADAELGEFPWAVLLGYKEKISEETEFRCGGTLINTRYVLTAAHCNAGRAKISFVVLGELEVGVDPDCPNYSQDPKDCQPKRQVIEVESITMHEDYTKNRQTGVPFNDIALVRLKKEAVLNVAVQPICLPLNEEQTSEDIGADNLEDGIVGRDATVVGWGATRNYQKINPDLGVAQNILQKVDIPIVSNDNCESKLSVLTHEGDDLIIGPKQICAGEEGSSRDSCKGDSGGGMFINSKLGSENLTHIYYITHYQIGIVSYGYWCGIGYPGVYIRVSQFIPWIKQKIFD